MTALQTIPLFPLPNVVLFPGMMLPLVVFEDRYQQLMQDILSADTDEVASTGSAARFGLNLYETYDPKTLSGWPYQIGTVAKVLHHERLEDGRYQIIILGESRYAIEECDDESKPYWMAQVSPYQDEPLATPFAEETRQKLESDFWALVKLSHKLLKHEPPAEITFPEHPMELSFFIAENIRVESKVHQAMLELQSTERRLELLSDLMAQVVKHLAAMAQIEDVFQVEG